MTQDLRYKENQIAVLIDLENIGLDCIQWLFDQVADAGRITIRRAYADWSLEQNKRDLLLELGIEAVPMMRTTKAGKNASDIRLAIDAIDLLYTSPVDIFVIVSSDTDYVPLAAKLRAAGKIVFGAGEEDKAPKTLVKSCDRYFYLEKLKGEAKAKTPKSKKQTEAIQDVVLRAVRASVDAHGQVKGSKLHENILKLDPGFNYKAFGQSTFRKFLEALPALRVSKPKGPGDVTIQIASQAIEEIPAPNVTDETWQDIDKAWTESLAKSGEKIPGPVAASDAAKVLGVAKISASPFKTLQGIINASKLLEERWKQSKNAVFKKQK